MADVIGNVQSLAPSVLQAHRALEIRTLAAEDSGMSSGFFRGTNTEQASLQGKSHRGF